MIGGVGRRGRHWLLVLAVSFGVLAVVLVVAAWLIASGERGWSRADALAIAAVVAAVVAPVCAQFGTPLFERWLERRSDTESGGGGRDRAVTASDVGVFAVGETVNQSVAGDAVAGAKIGVQVNIGSLVAQPAPAQVAGQIVVGEIPGSRRPL